MTTSTGRRGYVGIDRHWLNNPDLNDTALRLMLWLDSHTDDYLSNLSAKRTADELGWSRDRVKRALDALDELGLISTKQVPHPGGGKTRTQITLHQTAWTEGYATPQGTRMPHDEAQGMPHGKAPTTSTHMGEESTLELLSQTSFDDDPTAPTFDAWYEIFPQKQGKAVARKHWGKMSGPERIAAWDAAAAWSRYAKACPDGNQFVPHASSFLYQRRWEDDPPEVQVATANTRNSRSRGAIDRFLESDDRRGIAR